MPPTDRKASESAPMNSPHLLEGVGGRQQLVAVRRIDPVIIRMRDRRRGDAEMHFGGAGIAHHLHDLGRRGAAHDGIVDQYDALAGHDRAVGIMLQPHAELADLLGRLDEGAPDIMVANDAEIERDAGFLRIAERRRNAGIGDGTITSASAGASRASSPPMVLRTS